MEPLTEEDLDWLTRTENRLSRMPQRETTHRAKFGLVQDLTDTIKHIRALRIMLQVRFEKKQDDYL